MNWYLVLAIAAALLTTGLVFNFIYRIFRPCYPKRQLNESIAVSIFYWTLIIATGVYLLPYLGLSIRSMILFLGIPFFWWVCNALYSIFIMEEYLTISVHFKKKFIIENNLRFDNTWISKTFYFINKVAYVVSAVFLWMAVYKILF